MCPREPFEDNLLREAEGLDRFVRLFRTFDECVERLLDEYGKFLDPLLITCLEIIRYEVNLTLSSDVHLDHQRVQGLVRQLEDVLDEVQTLQAGMRTKDGIADEQVDPKSPPRS